jgi:hypothetical protein
VDKQELINVEEAPVQNPAGSPMTLTTGKLAKPIPAGPLGKPVVLPEAVEEQLHGGKLEAPRSELGRKVLGIERRRGHAPRRATNGRTRGSRRGTRSSSSSSDDPDEADPEPPGRTCAWCGGSLEGKRADALYCGDAHRLAAHRHTHAERDLVRNPAPVADLSRPCDKCPHLTTVPDEEGDPVCILCGTLVGVPSPPNGHRAILGLMVTDADGQYRRLHRKRQELRRWRDWQRREPVTITWVQGTGQ